MSKSLNNIFIPALGGTALLLGVAYGVTSRGHGQAEVSMLQDRLSQVETHVATANEKVGAEAERAATLEVKIAELETELASRPVGGGGSNPAPQSDQPFGLGREAMPEEVAAWNKDVQPDGTGLPVGSGDVFYGEEVFAEHCAICHGDFAEGVDNWPKLAGGSDTLDHDDPLKTVGSYWPYLSTVWDYVHRSMPFGAAQTLSVDDTYAIVAYILYSNDLVDDEFVLSNENFLDVEMPNAGGFIIDDREISEKHFWKPEPCMSDCKDTVEITMRAMVLDVTPEEEGADQASAEPAAETTEVVAVAEPAAEEPAATEEAVAIETVALDPELVAKGEKVFKKCKACHQVGEGASNKTGPVLTGVVGAPAAAVDGFKYSKPMTAAGEDGLVWTEQELAAFLTKPKDYMKKTKMSFSGLKKESDIEAVLTYLKSFGQ